MNPRYSRQILFSPIGEEGQAKLTAARVTLIGCGALGSAIADHLVRAGVGSLRICDRDFVELSNLQRQLLFDEEDVKESLPKAVAAQRKLARINSMVSVEPRVVDVTPGNVESLLEGATLVMDGTDNFETRFLLNDACVKNRIPWIYGGCVGSYGMSMTIRPGESACYACLVNDLPPAGSSPTCDTAGVLNTAIAVVAALQCTEALKLLTGRVQNLHDGLVTADVWSNEYRTFATKRLPDCRACVRREFRHLEAKQRGVATALCGRNAVQVTPATPVQLDLKELDRRISRVGGSRRNSYLLRVQIEAFEMSIFPDGRAIVHGTTDPARARSLYDKYVGS